MNTTKNNLEPQFQAIEPPQPTISQSPPIEITPTDSDEVIQLKHKVKRLQVIAGDRKRQLKLMWQSKKRLKRKLDQMKLMVKHLVQHKNLER